MEEKVTSSSCNDLENLEEAKPIFVDALQKAHSTWHPMRMTTLQPSIAALYPDVFPKNLTYHNQLYHQEEEEEEEDSVPASQIEWDTCSQMGE